MLFLYKTHLDLRRLQGGNRPVLVLDWYARKGYTFQCVESVSRSKRAIVEVLRVARAVIVIMFSFEWKCARVWT